MNKGEPTGDNRVGVLIGDDSFCTTLDPRSKSQIFTGHGDVSLLQRMFSGFKSLFWRKEEGN